MKVLENGSGILCQHLQASDVVDAEAKRDQHRVAAADEVAVSGGRGRAQWLRQPGVGEWVRLSRHLRQEGLGVVPEGLWEGPPGGRKAFTAGD